MFFLDDADRELIEKRRARSPKPRSRPGFFSVPREADPSSLVGVARTSHQTAPALGSVQRLAAPAASVEPGSPTPAAQRAKSPFRHNSAPRLSRRTEHQIASDADDGPRRRHTHLTGHPPRGLPLGSCAPAGTRSAPLRSTRLSRQVPACPSRGRGASCRGSRAACARRGRAGQSPSRRSGRRRFAIRAAPEAARAP